MTSIEYLVEQLEPIQQEGLKYIIEDAKQMHYKEIMDSMQKGMELQEKENNRVGFRERNGLLPQQEISDEEIEKASEPITNIGNRRKYWKEGAKWYREQLKQRQ